MLDVDPSQRDSASIVVNQFMLYCWLAPGILTEKPVARNSSLVFYPWTRINLAGLGQDYEWPTRFAVSSRNSYLAIGACGYIILWNLEFEGRNEQLLIDSHNVLEFGPPDMGILASGGCQGVAFWDVATGARVLFYSTGGEVEIIAFSASGTRVALSPGWGASTIEVLGLTGRGTELCVVSNSKVHCGDLGRGYPSYQGDPLCLYVLEDESFDLYDVEDTSNIIHRVGFRDPRPLVRTVPVTTYLDNSLLDLMKFPELHIYPRNRHIILTKAMSGFWVWNFDDGKRSPIYLESNNFELFTFKFTPCGEFVLIADSTAEIKTWSLATERVIHVITLPKPVRYIWFLEGEMDNICLALCLHMGHRRVFAIDFEKEKRKFVH
jgi:WD40 repeat protein